MSTPPVIRCRRVYDAPAPGDGLRVLVDRLWPRGLSREATAVDLWCRDLAPSDELRRWFGHRPERWEEFRRRYREELQARTQVVQELLDRIGDSGRATLLYAARDTERNNAVVLKEYLLEQPGIRQ
ncbi:MAG: DUF488 family protein [Gammaproteobacteria bacterium]|nr:MAG: DUF488 family protein [Gammaproteobacteria bacterium]